MSNGVYPRATIVRVVACGCESAACVGPRFDKSVAATEFWDTDVPRAGPSVGTRRQLDRDQPTALSVADQPPTSVTSTETVIALSFASV